MIDKRFLNFRNYSTFKSYLDAGEIRQDSIVFVADENKTLIWTHGKEYLCGGGEVSEAILTLLNAKVDKSALRTLTTTRYQQLVDNDQVDPNTYYFTYEGEDEEEHTGWVFGDTFPAIFTERWAFGGTFPITLT